MAAIDKIYVKSFYEYDDLLMWAFVYYPKLLMYFYNIHMTYADFEKHKDDYVSQTRKDVEKEFEKMGGRGLSREEYVENLRKHYKKFEYDAPDSQLNYEVDYILDLDNKTDDELRDSFSCPITNTPTFIDRKLKWLCPIPFVRKYLHENCGVNPKYEWFYRLFWKGKEFFS